MSVLGSVLGELDGLDEDTLHGVGAAVSKAIAKRGGNGATIHVRKPSWRDGELAPGVNAPQGGRFPSLCWR